MSKQPSHLILAKAPEAFARNVYQPGAPVGYPLKRVVDIVGSLSLLVLFAPLMAVIAVLVRCFNGGPVIFSQERVGLAGRTFRILKFRTMAVDADAALKKVLDRDTDLSSEWSQRQKMQHDPRVTRLGRVLRLSSIDELPQLFNVLKGEMSLVGPRPIVADEVARYGRHFGQYCSVSPGLTGLWQVRRNISTTYRRRVALDLAYSRRIGLGLDLLILVKTVPAVFAGYDR
ncbi:MAG: sugar transferase [Novosphingobium sp.]